MRFLVLLDASPLGMVTNPRDNDKTRACKNWLKGLLAADVEVKVPEGADYEIRRELLFHGRPKGIDRLDALAGQIGTFPITSDVLREAASIWAEMRRLGTPTAHDKAVDFDVILCAQARVAERAGFVVVVATSNIKHLEQFSDAREWHCIGVSPLDPESVQGLRFRGGATLERIINQDVDVYVTTSEDYMTGASLCRTFIKDGNLWLDLIPRHPRKYVVPVPSDAIIGRNETDLSAGRFGVILDGHSQAGLLLSNLAQAKFMDT